jgi:hypothetical protein
LSNKQLEANRQISILNTCTGFKYRYQQLQHLKYLGTRICYNVNTTATFQLQLLLSGDISLNPGPNDLNVTEYKYQSQIRYCPDNLKSLNKYSNEAAPLLTPTLWKHIKSLKICARIPKRRGKRGGRRKWPKDNDMLTNSANNSAATNTESITSAVNKRSSLKSACSKFALWNAWSIKSKTCMIADLVISNRIDILAITETWLNGDHRDDHSIADLTST